MDPVSIVGLVGSCLAIGGNIVSVITGLQQIVKAFKEADKNIAQLSTQLDLFNATIEQLRIWLNDNRSLSSSLRNTMKTAFENCDVIVSDIEERVQAVQRQPGESESSFGRKVKHLWNDNAIKEHERRINNQLVAFTLLIQMVQLNSATEPDKQKRLHKRLLKEHFAKTAEDARSVTESQSAASRVGDYTSDNGENLSVEFSTDKEIIRSKPYARQNKRLLKAYFRDRGLQFGTISENVKAQKSDRNVEESTALTPHRHQPRPPSPRASHGRQHASEISHTWKLFQEETRKKADKLCSAARNGDLIQVRSLIEDLGAFIDAHDEKGDTPLLCATEFGRARIVHYLLRKGASVHLSSHIESGEDSADSKQLQEVYSPIHLAVKVGAVDIVDLLITSKANVNDARCEMVKYNDQGDSVIVKDTTPLHLTTYDPECKVADQLLQHCASLSVQDSDGYTPLMLAVEKSNTHAVRIFLEAGAPLDPGDVDVVSPFEIACNKLSENSQECLEVFILLIKHGADIKKRRSGHSPIIELCLQSPLSERHIEALHLLLQAGADPDVLEPVADESEKPGDITPLACLMPSRLVWSNGEGKKELAIRAKIVTTLMASGVVKWREDGFVALSRLMYGFFNYCEDMQRWFPFVLDFAILLVKAGAKFSDACPYLAKQKPFEEKSRRSIVGKRILCALHIVAEHTDKSYKYPGDFMAETRAEFSQWVGDGCRRRKWPWAMIPFEIEQHFKTHRTGGLTGWLVRLGQ